MWEWISASHIEKIVGCKEYRNKGDENVELTGWKSKCFQSFYVLCFI